jgi:hypothetical protein
MKELINRQVVNNLSEQKKKKKKKSKREQNESILIQKEPQGRIGDN